MIDVFHHFVEQDTPGYRYFLSARIEDWPVCLPSWYCWVVESHHHAGSLASWLAGWRGLLFSLLSTQLSPPFDQCGINYLEASGWQLKAAGAEQRARGGNGGGTVTGV